MMVIKTSNFLRTFSVRCLLFAHTNKTIPLGSFKSIFPDCLFMNPEQWSKRSQFHSIETQTLTSSFTEEHNAYGGGNALLRGVTLLPLFFPHCLESSKKKKKIVHLGFSTPMISSVRCGHRM